MIFALKNGERITATPKAQAICPTCGQTVLAKCGRIKIWHWAHIINDCDPWSEGPTQWHLDWQSMFPAEWQEINLSRGGQKHRADVYTPSGIVLEFQHSSISPDDIIRREKFYGLLMRWVFDARDAYAKKRLSFSHQVAETVYIKIYWKFPRTTFGYARRPVYLDIGDGLLIEVRKMNLSSPARGWGYLTNRDAFVNRILEGA